MKGSKLDQINEIGCRLVLFLWIIFLFEPARLVAYYFPIFGFLKWIPEIILYGTFLYCLTSPVKMQHYKTFFVFILVNLLGTVIAFWNGNWGIAREINRFIIQYYVLAILTLTFVNRYEKIEKLLFLYLIYFLYYALWGVISLKVLPIDPSIDPGTREIVPWHIWLDNRDGFGPLMVMGMAFSYYYYRAVRDRKVRFLSIGIILLCLTGVVSSFGRAVFLAMGGTIIFIWVQFKDKIGGIFLILLFAGGVLFLASIISPKNLYWERMKTISDGTETDSGEDRKVLWELAWKQFLANPVFGVGTGNFGVSAARDLPEEEILKKGYTRGRLWGRALHCAPLTILCEYGLFGGVIFIFLNLDFIFTNLRIKETMISKNNEKNARNKKDFLERRYLYSIVSGLMACFMAFWINALFYEIIYAPFLWYLLTMNKLIERNLSPQKAILVSFRVEKTQ